MRKNRMFYIGTCLMVIMSSCTQANVNKENQYAKEYGNAYFEYGSKRIAVDSIIGKWEISSVTFREAISEKQMAYNYIDQSQRFVLEMSPEKHLLIDGDTIGSWYENDHYLVLNGKPKKLPIPFFVNVKYRVTRERFVYHLTCFFQNKQKPHHEVRYILHKKS